VPFQQTSLNWWLISFQKNNMTQTTIFVLAQEMGKPYGEKQIGFALMENS